MDKNIQKVPPDPVSQIVGTNHLNGHSARRAEPLLLTLCPLLQGSAGKTEQGTHDGNHTERRSNDIVVVTRAWVCLSGGLLGHAAHWSGRSCGSLGVSSSGLSGQCLWLWGRGLGSCTRGLVGVSRCLLRTSSLLCTIRSSSRSLSSGELVRQRLVFLLPKFVERLASRVGVLLGLLFSS